MPYNEYVLVNKKDNNNSAIKVNTTDISAIEENEEDISQSTTFNGLERVGFRKNWTPLFPQKSADYDSMSNLTNSTNKDFNVESDFDSMQCDSTIQNEASHLANNIFNDIKGSDVDSYDSKSDFHSLDDRNSDTFLVSTSNEVVVLKDFAFEDQRNFFEMPDNLRIPLCISNIPIDNSHQNIPKHTSPLNIPKVSMCIKVAEELSLIEEITEHSSLSTVKSNEVTPRNAFDASEIPKLQSSKCNSLNQHSVQQQLQETPIMKFMWKTLVQGHIDYCSQLYFPSQSRDLQQLEELQKTYTKKIPEVQNMDYWSRLS